MFETVNRQLRLLAHLNWWFEIEKVLFIQDLAVIPDQFVFICKMKKEERKKRKKEKGYINYLQYYY